MSQSHTYFATSALVPITGAYIYPCHFQGEGDTILFQSGGNKHQNAN